MKVTREKDIVQKFSKENKHFCILFSRRLVYAERLWSIVLSVPMINIA